jgi:hypothetical protein
MNIIDLISDSEEETIRYSEESTVSTIILSDLEDEDFAAHQTYFLETVWKEYLMKLHEDDDTDMEDVSDAESEDLLGSDPYTALQSFSNKYMNLYNDSAFN